MSDRRTKHRALVVDDEPDIRDLLSLTLRRMQVEVETANDRATAVRRLGSEVFDLVLTDMRLPDGDGLDVVQWIQQQRPGVPVAVITAHGNVETAVRALKLGAFDFVSKPLDLGALRKGDSGTGKELVARLIHESGPRRDGPFVPVNCGAIPSELMESELFGHKKGSFTGAVADKEGLIRSAEGGTLFLDEVADLPLHMQVKLLRVIQEKSVRPVGETREVPVDVRILSATHRRLDELVKGGRFREDLYYRINVIELRVPALRERLDDVPALVDVLLDRVARQIGVRRPQISDEAMDKLLSYAYPGNVRELENILERAVTLCSHHRVEPEDIQLKQGQLLSDLPELSGRAASDELGVDGLEGQLESIQREAIVRALEQTRYNKTRAAELLGMTFRQLRYRVKKLGIE
ncbi:MAG: response regulator [Steroidobacteraceae bacterium]|nr:response regulator [Steroidobacteraceae bacterium]